MLRSWFFWKFYLVCLAAIAASVVVVGALVEGQIQRNTLHDAQQELHAAGLLLDDVAAAGLSPGEDPAAQDRLCAMAQRAGVRVTLIRADGRVLADSVHLVARLENMATRPEIMAASRGGDADALRGNPRGEGLWLYHADTLRVGDRIIGYLRVSESVEQVVARTARIRRVVIAGLSTGALAAMAVGFYLTGAIARPAMGLTRSIQAIAGGDYQLPARLPSGREFRSVSGALRELAAQLRQRAEVVQERDRVTQELRRYQLLADHSRDVILFVRHRDGRILQANAAAEQIYGYTRDQLLDKTIYDLRTPAAQAAAAAQLDDAGAGGVLFETEHRRADGRAFPVEVSSRGATIDGERILLSIVRDVTERKQAEASLRDSEEKYRQVYELDSDATFMVDTATGRFLDANPAACRLYGYTREELLQLGARDVSAEPERTSQVIREHAAHVPMRWHRRKDGTLIPVEIYASFFVWQGREVHVSAIRDLSVRVEGQTGSPKLSTFLRSILDANPSLICVVDRQSRVVVANGAAAEFFGRPCEQIVGRAVPELVPAPALAAMVLRGNAAILAGSTDRVEWEDELPATDGQRRWLHHLRLPLRDPAGGVSHVVAVCTDITARKEAEQAVLVAREELERFITCLPDLVCIASADGRLEKVNRAWTDTLGYSVEELTGACFLDFIHPEDVEPTRREIARQVAGEITDRFQNRYRSKQGAYRWLEWRATATVGGNRLYAAARDVTDRKRAIDLLAESEERFARAFCSAPTAIVISTLAEGRVIDANERFLEFVGLIRQAVIGRTTIELGLWERLAEREDFLRMLRLNGEVRDQEVRYLHVAGGPRDALLSSELTSLHGQECLLTFIQDVTERNRAELVARRQLSQLAHLSRLESVGQLATALAHELNQPLAAILNYGYYCQRLLDHQAASSLTLPEALAKIVERAAHAGQIIHRLRAFVARHESRRVSTSLNTLVMEALGLLGSEIRHHQIHVHAALAEGLPPVMVDSIQIQQVLVNLIQNAVEAMSAPGWADRELTVETTRGPHAHVMARVIDTGPGLPPDQQQRLFDPFFTTKASGLGIGLSVSKAIIESHRGRLNARPRADRGMVFELVLPVETEVSNVQGVLSHES